MLKSITTSERSTKGTRLCILLDLRSTRKQDKLVWTLVSQGTTKHSVSLPCQSLSARLSPFLLHAFLKTRPRDTAHILSLWNGDDAERNSAEHNRVAAQERIHSQSTVVCPH